MRKTLGAAKCCEPLPLTPVGSLVGVYELYDPLDTDHWCLCDGRAWPPGSFTSEGTVPDVVVPGWFPVRFYIRYK